MCVCVCNIRSYFKSNLKNRIKNYRDGNVILLGREGKGKESENIKIEVKQVK